MAVDLSVYQNQKTLADYQRNNQQFALQNALGQSQLQTQSIAAQQQKNIYATQLISSAVDQPSYDRARQILQQQGIDASQFAPDYETGKTQAYQARLAQSPLGSLLNAGLKAEGNLNQGAATFGSAGAAAQNDPMSAILARGLGGMMGGIPQNAPVTADPRGAPSNNPPPLPQQSGDPQNDFNAALAQAQAQNGVSPAQSPNLSNLVAQPPVQSSLPQQLPGESASAYQNRIANDPSLIRARKEAEAVGSKSGEHIGEAGKTFDIMQANLPAVLQRFQQMRDASKDASSGMGVNSEGDGFAQQWANTGFGSDKTSKANNILMQRSAQGILPELGPQLAQAGVKGNKFLETIANNASGLNMSAKADDKISLVNGLESTYINNLKATAAQLRANGQQAPSDAEIDAAVQKYKSASPAPATSAPKMGTIEDGHVFLGGDPSDPARWRKVQ